MAVAGEFQHPQRFGCLRKRKCLCRDKSYLNVETRVVQFFQAAQPFNLSNVGSFVLLLYVCLGVRLLVAFIEKPIIPDTYNLRVLS